MLGGVGHAVVPAIEEAMFFQNLCMKTSTKFIVKGDNPLTESYSAFLPEVETYFAKKIKDWFDNYHIGIGIIEDYDRIIIAGQAKSHCVAYTVQTLANCIERSGIDTFYNRLYLLEDCTSPVIIPNIVDFTEQANEKFKEFENKGIHVIKSDICLGDV